MSDEDYFGAPDDPEEQPAAAPTAMPNNSDPEYPEYDEKPAGSHKLLAAILITAILLVIAAAAYILYKQAQNLNTTPATKTSSVRKNI